MKIVLDNFVAIAALILCVTHSQFAEITSLDVTHYGDAKLVISDQKRTQTDFTYNRLPLYNYSADLLKNQRFNRISLLFSPLTTMSFGNFKDPLKLKVGLLTHVEVSLWKGAQLDLRYAFPFYNEIDTSLTPFPKLAVMRNSFYTPSLGYITISGGIFANNRWGFDLAWDKLSPKKVFQFSVDLGYTGHSQFQDSTFNYSALNRITGRIKLINFNKKFKMRNSLSLGRFLEKDWGGTVELLRSFKIADIYLYFSLTSLGHNGGAGFTAPLWKRRYPSLKGLKIGPYRYYDWRYRYRSVDPPGNDYKTGCELDYYLWLLHPFRTEENKLKSE